MKSFIEILAATLVVGTGTAGAQTPIDLPRFDSLELRGGGKVTIRHGERQSVTIVSGDPETSRFTVDDQGRLTILACRSVCRDHRLVVAIVTPAAEGVGIRDGGTIRADGGFPFQDVLAAGVIDGGTIDVAAIEAGTVTAGIQGGGSIRVNARDRLVAGIQDGGSIRYLGHPAVTSGVNGGGSVAPIEP